MEQFGFIQGFSPTKISKDHNNSQHVWFCEDGKMLLLIYVLLHEVHEPTHRGDDKFIEGLLKKVTTPSRLDGKKNICIRYKRFAFSKTPSRIFVSAHKAWSDDGSNISPPALFVAGEF